MDSYGWIGLEEPENLLGFMCAQVVGHDVNFSALRLAGNNLAEKVDKLGAGMPSGGLADDVTGTSVQRVIQRACHDENIQSHAVRLCQGRAAKPGQVGRVLG